MRCKVCDYRLWNLGSRQCPECGTPFVPSQYEFVPNSVQFCCPHCQRAYYGTGPRGHLVPPAFQCAACGRHIRMDEMVLLPTAGLEEDQTRVDRMPWLDRERCGFFKSWFLTIGRSMVSPGRLMRSVPPDSPAHKAWWYAVWTNTPIMLLSAGGVVLFGLVLVSQVLGGGVWAALAGLGAVLCVALLLAVVGTVVGIAIWGGLAHALLRLTGPTAGRLGYTCQAICYSTGANVLTALPCVGAYFGWIWWVVSAVLMVKEAQKVQGWRAALAVLALPALLIFSVITLYAVFIAVVISNVSSMTTMPVAPQTETGTVLHAVLNHARDHDGQGPDHAILLVSGDYLSPPSLVAGASPALLEDVPVAGITLQRFANLSGDGQRLAARTAIDTLPDGTVAHRLGGFVFTYHGIDLADADAELWLVILSPEPDADALPSDAFFRVVGLADGTVQTIAINRLPARLAEQNGLRAELGLPPLPHPATVTHARPAVAQP